MSIADGQSLGRGPEVKTAKSDALNAMPLGVAPAHLTGDAMMTV
jgi:hypothetical protein